MEQPTLPDPAKAAEQARHKIALSLHDITLITPLTYDELRKAVHSGKLAHRRAARNKIVVLRADLDQYLLAL